MRRAPRNVLALSLFLFALLAVAPLAARAGGERELLASINAYRAHPSGCAWSRVQRLPPLSGHGALALPLDTGENLRETLREAGYRAQAVRSIRLVGAQDAGQAFAMLRQRYCTALLDPQYGDAGVTREGDQWRLVLASPGAGGQPPQDPRSTARALLAEVNAARARPRLCGSRRFAAARPLAWSPALGAAAQAHSRDMAHENYFAHRGLGGDMPADRARAAGYRGRQIGENIAAGQPSVSQAMAGWLASPGHCANLMNPLFTQAGAAYASAARSDEGIYWTLIFGAP